MPIVGGNIRIWLPVLFLDGKCNKGIQSKNLHIWKKESKQTLQNSAWLLNKGTKNWEIMFRVRKSNWLVYLVMWALQQRMRMNLMPTRIHTTIPQQCFTPKKETLPSKNIDTWHSEMSGDDFGPNWRVMTLICMVVSILHFWY